jgi:hypothetical protein
VKRIFVRAPYLRCGIGVCQIGDEDSGEGAGYVDATLRTDDPAAGPGPAGAGAGAGSGSGSGSGGGGGGGGGGGRIGVGLAGLGGSGDAPLTRWSEEAQLARQGHKCPGCDGLLTASFLSRNYLPCRYFDKLFCKRFCHQNEHRCVLPHVPLGTARGCGDGRGRTLASTARWLGSVPLRAVPVSRNLFRCT